MRKIFFVLLAFAMILAFTSCATNVKYIKTPFPEKIKTIAVLPTKNVANTDDKNALKNTRILMGGMLNERTRYKLLKFQEIDSAMQELGITVSSLNSESIQKLANKLNADAIIVPELLVLKTEKGLLKSTLIATVNAVAYDSSGNKIFENDGTYEEKQQTLETAITKKIAGKVTTVYYDVIREAVYKAIKPFPRGK